MSKTTVAPDDLVAVMAALADALETHKERLNRLNVFPVPDGDTGTNMALTARAVVDALSGLDGAGAGLLMEPVCSAIAHGSLMGARGNSGVILCQILRAMTTRFTASEAIGAAEFVEALEEGSSEARAAVFRPAEGTILTVASGAASGSRQGLERGADLVGVVVLARQGAVEALFRTPELLPVLAEAGVVDAGGAGLVLLFDAFLHVLDGRALPAALELPEGVNETISSRPLEAAPEPEIVGDLAPAALRYEVMYLLEAPDETVPFFKAVWAGIGDSIVVVGGDGLWNCHVHTDDIGAAIEAALDVGRPRHIRVSDLAEQVEEEQWVRQGEGSATREATLSERVEQQTSVVAVAIGDGVHRIFASLGVSDVVAGSQTMNPSTAEILKAVDAAAGREVVLLPNNSNVFPVAAQVARLASKPVTVVSTRGIQEGFAALLEYDPQASGEENGQRMDVAASRVVAGEVTQAVRAATTKAGQVEAGDWLGLSRSGVEVIGASLDDATCALLERLLTPAHEIVTLIEGSGASAADTRKVTEWLHAKHPDLTIERHAGGQPLYPFLVSIE